MMFWGEDGDEREERRKKRRRERDEGAGGRDFDLASGSAGSWSVGRDR
jgi:hypothetical protein